VGRRSNQGLDKASSLCNKASLEDNKMPMVITSARAEDGALHLELGYPSGRSGTCKVYTISEATFREAHDPAFTLAFAMNAAMGRQEKHDV